MTSEKTPSLDLATIQKEGMQILDEIAKFIGKTELTNVDTLNKLFYKQPKKAWIKYNALAKSYYIPIGVIETILHKVFTRFKIEVVSYSQLANSVAVHMRFHYWDPVHSEWSFHDGVGAAPLQLKKDKAFNTIDFSAMQTSAVQMALPAAKSFAFKDAVHHLGPLFGRDLNRENTLDYASAYEESLKNFSKSDPQ